MAASDQTYRNQHWLDIAFVVTSALMLFSIVWMFVDDYNREWKPSQRRFRDVETAIAQRLALEQIPTAKDFKEAETALQSARTKRQEDDQHYKENKAEIDKELGDKASDRYYVANKAKLDSLAGDKQRSDMRFNDTKADLESILSFYNEEMEINPDSDRAKEYKKKIVELEKKLAEAK